MPKHEPVETTLGEAVDQITSGDPWCEVMGINLPGWQEAMDSDDYEAAGQIEADYLKAHGDDAISVTWPEHVLIPRFNSDANYRA